MIHHNTLKSLFEAGVNAVRGDSAVDHALSGGAVCDAPDQIIAVGKAATAMAGCGPCPVSGRARIDRDET